MDWWLANFFLGSILSLFLPIVPDIFVLFSILLLSIIFFFYSTNGRNGRKPLRLSSGLLFGMSWMLFNGFEFQHKWQGNNLEAIELASKAHWLEGRVLSLQSPQKQNDNGDHKASSDHKKVAQVTKYDRLRFNFNVTHINHYELNNDDLNNNKLKKQKLTKDIKLRLSWKNSPFVLQQGQRVLLKVKFKPTHGLANQGGFNYQTWLNNNSISGTGYVINHKNNRLLDSKLSFRQQLFNDYKQLLSQYSFSYSPKNTHQQPYQTLPEKPPKQEVYSSTEHELAPLLLALGFGSKTELNTELWRVLQATGTGHLVAISGLHIGLVATGSYFLFMLLIRILPLQYLPKSDHLQVINSRYFAIGFSLAIALGYGYLAGFSLPTIRALVMLSLYWIIRLLAINLSIKRWLLLTLFLLTLMTPFSLFSASFWLSVYAVIIIFLTLWRFKHVVSRGNKAWRFVKGLVVIQLSLTLMLLPISAVFFQQLSLVSIFANIIAVPWMSFISIPLCLLSVLLITISTTLSQFCIMLCVESLQILWLYLSYLSTLPWAVIELSVRDTQGLIVLGVMSVLLLFFQPKLTFVNDFVNDFIHTFIHIKPMTKNSHKMAIFCCLLLIASALLIRWNNTDNVSITKQSATQLDNEQLEHWQLVVFDVGQGLSLLIKHQQKAILYDTGASYRSGFNMAEAVILPYLQYAGIKKLDKVIISHSDNDHAGGLAILQKSIAIDELFYNSSKDKERHLCLQGKSFNWQGLTFEILWPEKPVAKENDDSCVLLVSDGKHKVLLTGDISKKTEKKLIEKYPQLQADILIVPHHGSKTSSSESFIKQINPNLAIVSAGFLNRWHMPVAEVVQRYQDNNIDLINTSNVGQIIIDFSELGITQQTYRDDLWPFWFAKSSKSD